MVNPRWESSKKRIKGRFGEGIVEALLEEVGYEVLRYGQEWKKMAEVSPESFGQAKADLATRTRPDFAILRKGKVRFVEAKFLSELRSLPYLAKDVHLPELCKAWPATTYVVVCPEPPHLLTVDPDVINVRDTSQVSVRYIWDDPHLGVSERVCAKYIEVIKAFPTKLLRSSW